MVTDQVAPPDLVRPAWRRLRFWLALAVAAVLGAIVLGSLGDSPTRPLDPRSSDKDGSLAVARLIEGYGTRVVRTTSLDTAASTDATVLVTDPDAYSSGQLRGLSRTSDRLVLVAPNERAARAVLPGAGVVDPGDTAGDIADEPGCLVPAAASAGDIDWPESTIAYRGPTTCYGGAVAADNASQPAVVVLGSPSVLHNEDLDGRGAAALSVNLLTADRTASRVVWLLPGPDAGGDGPATVWDLFPGGAYRVFWWLLAVGVVVALWRARRLGGVVSEPLPVVVRAAEIVEGHGRLYERAGARAHAAAPLRDATVRRLAERLALPRASTAEQVAAAAALLVARPTAELVTLLAGAPPTDDAGLVRLARELDRLDVAVDVALTEGRS